jgi:uncharacterized protein YndB with AHSA1/START domain
MADVQVTKDLENKKLIIEFVVNGTKDKVWRAYSDKEWFEKWWGPEGWETTTKEFNFTEGGIIHYDMKCVDEAQGEWFGQSSWGLMEISTIDEGNSFSYTDYFSDEAGNRNPDMPSLNITNEFIETDGTTTIVSTSLAESAEHIEQLIKMGMIEGFSSQLNRLEKLLAE